MDLRTYINSVGQVEEAKRLLNYPPFIISDEIHTGVAHSWLYAEAGGRRVYAPHEFVFEKAHEKKEDDDKAYDANGRLMGMYDDFLDAIAARFEGVTFADIACNNGYFLAGAALRGMRRCTGIDREDYGESVRFLNKNIGVNARLMRGAYSSWTHRIDGLDAYGVVAASQVMQHISDPLYFLSFAASRAKKALFCLQEWAKQTNIESITRSQIDSTKTRTSRIASATMWDYLRVFCLRASIC